MLKLVFGWFVHVQFVLSLDVFFFLRVYLLGCSFTFIKGELSELMADL